MKRVAFLLLAIGYELSAMSLPAAQLNLSWDPSPDIEVTGYYLYSGHATRAYTNRQDAGVVPWATITNLVPSTTYYFAATAYVAAGLESDPSSEFTYTVPAAAPQTNHWQLITPGSGLVTYRLTALGSWLPTNLPGPLLLEDPSRIYWRGFDLVVTNWYTVDGVYQSPPPPPDTVLVAGVRWETSPDLVTWQTTNIVLLTLTNPPGAQFFRATAWLTNR